LHDATYPHPVNDIELIETHISWVILTGSVAYKIKKPVKLEFLDFSSLERRKHFCDDELRLNRRWAPELYLGVVPICGTLLKPVVDGDGDVIEYAVKMQQFPQSAQLDAQLDAGLLVDADMLELAEMIAEQHGMAEVIDQLGAGDADRLVRHPMLENIEHLKPYVAQDELRCLATWFSNELENLWPTLLQRQDKGYIRECHGDFHLANLVRLPSGISAFDCVEFSTELRSIDVLSDAAFLMMDLTARGRQDLAFRFMNRYLEITGDYDGMAVFGLYYVYHALIRAKIAAIRGVERTKVADRRRDQQEIADFCSVANRWIERRRPCLVAMHGFSASGKTWLSDRLVSRLPAIRVRSDIERKRVYGLDETEASGSPVGERIYRPAARSEIYSVLAAAAETCLQLGLHVIADASFLRRADRQQFSELASMLDANFIIVDTSAKPEELLRRVGLRGLEAGDASEADANVLRYQFDSEDPLEAAELERTVVVATDADVDPTAVAELIQSACAGLPGQI
jgi:hypothetical protein